MLRSRLFYLLGLWSVLAFYFANGEWYSFFLLVLMLLLPLFSFLCSLFFMLRTKITPSLPSELLQGAEGALVLEQTGSRLPYRVRVGKQVLRPAVHGVFPLVTEHCGKQYLTLRRCRVFDALGLIGIKKALPASLSVTVLPRPVPPKERPDPALFRAVRFRPRPAGLTEQQELREYRPGDPARMIHWKASLKSDSLIVREPQDPIRQRIVLGLRSPENAYVFDVSFAELRWLSQWLTEQEIPHEVCFLHSGEIVTCKVSDAETHHGMLLSVAEVVPGAEDPLPDAVSAGADWFCLVGKEGDG